MPNVYEFSCGCKLPILDDKLKPEDGLPSIELDYYKINKRCGHTWGLISRGLTKGVFQLEKALGQTWSQKIQPLSISELSALISLIRPGTLEAKITTALGEKNLTQLYVDRKNGIEPIEYLDPAVEGILEETLGILTFQESAMQIATKVAGFSEQDADSLRKAMGKKSASEMTKVKKMFIDGVEKHGVVSKEVGDQLFDWIEKSQRYSFNRCVVGSTTIELTSGKSVKVKDLVGKSGYMSWSLDYESMKFVKNEVVKVAFAGIRPCYEVVFSTGKSVIVSDNHKFPVVYDTCNTEKLARSLYVDGETVGYDIQHAVREKQIKDCTLSDIFFDKTFRYLRTTNIISIKPVGNRETYDVTMAAPHHNFVCNDGVVTCNSHAVSYAYMGYWSAYVKCLSPETIVETNEGYKNLDEVRIGDYVLAPSDSDNSDELVEVVDKFDNGIQDLYEITLESGRTIECTIEHKFLCEDGVIRPLWEIIELDLKIMCQDD